MSRAQRGMLFLPDGRPILPDGRQLDPETLLPMEAPLLTWYPAGELPPTALVVALRLDPNEKTPKDMGDLEVRVVVGGDHLLVSVPLVMALNVDPNQTLAPPVSLWDQHVQDRFIASHYPVTVPLPLPLLLCAGVGFEITIESRDGPIEEQIVDVFFHARALKPDELRAWWETTASKLVKP